MLPEHSEIAIELLDNSPDALGVNAYVVKPVDFQQFLEAIKQIGAFWAVMNQPPPNNNQNGD